MKSRAVIKKLREIYMISTESRAKEAINNLIFDLENNKEIFGTEDTYEESKE